MQSYRLTWSASMGSVLVMVICGAITTVVDLQMAYGAVEIYLGPQVYS